MEENKKEAGLKKISGLKEHSDSSEGLLSLKIPEELEAAFDEKVSEKFPYELRPQEVYMNEKGKKIFTLNLLENRLEDKQVHVAVREIQRMIAHIYPESIQIQARILKIAAGTAGWFSFVTGGIPEDICHIMFILPVMNRMMLGSYHFPIDQEREERKVFLKLLNSIRIKDEIKEEAGKKDVGIRI